MGKLLSAIALVAASRSCLSLATLALALWSSSASAEEVAGLTLTTAPPEGFANLTDEQMLLVDVYFGGRRLGEAMVRSISGDLTIEDPASVVSLLPPLRDSQIVEAVLAAKGIAANSNLACGKMSDPTQCGKLIPETAGVILDRENLRLDVFVNPRLLNVQGTENPVYLPAATSTLSLVNSVSGIMAGELESRLSSYSLQDSLIISNGARRLRADVSFDDRHGMQADRLAFEWDRPEIRFSAGALWSPGNDLDGRQKLLGFGFESQIDTRLDKDGLRGTPLIVFLNRRARVDVYRDGRLVHSAIYGSGNQQIDTSSFPEGAYQVRLNIEEAGAAPREEKRYFTKGRRIPSVGRTNFFAYAGLGIDPDDNLALKPSGDVRFQGGIIHRFSNALALDGSVAATGESISSVLGASLFTSLARLRFAAVADAQGTTGEILQVTSANFSRLNFNFDLRRINNKSRQKASSTWSDSIAGLSETFGNRGRYTQVAGVVSYGFKSLRLLGTFFYRDGASEGANYSVGPSIEWDFLRKRDMALTFRSELTATEQGKSGFVGVSLRMFGARGSIAALAGDRRSSMKSDPLGQGAVSAISGTWTPALSNADLSVGAGFEHQPRQDNAIITTDFHHPLVSIAGDVSRSSGPSTKGTQYSLGFQTSVATEGQAIRVAGKTTSDSMIVARVKGAEENNSFEVLVNDQLAGKIEGSRSLVLTLPSYREYEVRIRSNGESLLAYDAAPRSVALYPGALVSLEWTASPISIKFGKLIAPNGKPIRGASIFGQGAWSETDENGNFQIEVADGVELAITTAEGQTYSLSLPSARRQDLIANMGLVVCCSQTRLALGTSNGPDVPYPSGAN